MTREKMPRHDATVIQDAAREHSATMMMLRWPLSHFSRLPVPLRIFTSRAKCGFRPRRADDYATRHIARQYFAHAERKVTGRHAYEHQFQRASDIQAILYWLQLLPSHYRASAAFRHDGRRCSMGFE